MIYLGDSTKDPSKLFKHHSVDAIISDPPYGIFGETLDKHYNRNESNVLSLKCSRMHLPMSSFYILLKMIINFLTF